MNLYLLSVKKMKTNGDANDSDGWENNIFKNRIILILLTIVVYNLKRK